MIDYTYQYVIIGYDEFNLPISNSITNDIEFMDDKINYGLHNDRIYVIEVYENRILSERLIKSQFDLSRV